MQEISELNPALNEEHLTIQAMQAEMSQLKQVASKNKQNTLILHNSMPAFFKVLLLGTIQS